MIYVATERAEPRLFDPAEPPPWKAVPAARPDPRRERDRRKMPAMSKIEEHWDLRPGYCARCRQPARCEKAHIIDRCYGGLDGAQNLVPLCYPCHSKQPSYEPGDEPLALEWVFHDRRKLTDLPGGYDEIALRTFAAMLWLRVATDLDDAGRWLTQRTLRRAAA